jgi:hypothetical protein
LCCSGSVGSSDATSNGNGSNGSNGVRSSGMCVCVCACARVSSEAHDRSTKEKKAPKKYGTLKQKKYGTRQARCACICLDIKKKYRNSCADTTNGNGSSNGSNSNGHCNEHGSSGDSGGGVDSNNGVSSNEVRCSCFMYPCLSFYVSMYFLSLSLSLSRALSLSCPPPPPSTLSLSLSPSLSLSSCARARSLSTRALSGCAHLLTRLTSRGRARTTDFLTRQAKMEAIFLTSSMAPVADPTKATSIIPVSLSILRCASLTVKLFVCVCVCVCVHMAFYFVFQIFF